LVISPRLFIRIKMLAFSNVLRRAILRKGNGDRHFFKDNILNLLDIERDISACPLAQNWRIAPGQAGATYLERAVASVYTVWARVWARGEGGKAEGSKAQK